LNLARIKVMPADATTLDRMPILPFLDPRLARPPGLAPLDPADWLNRDTAFAAQMALRDRLVAERPGAVMALRPGAEAALDELVTMVCRAVATDPGYAVEGAHITRPDGVALDRGASPLELLARLVQEDMLLLLHGDEEYRLAGGTLLFPARWSLAEKLGRGLEAIHGPVPFYAGDLARRVARLFAALHPDRPLWRANWLLHDSPDLHQPAREADRPPRRLDGPIWLRVERQTLRRLAGTGAVVFGIRTFVAPLDSLSRSEMAGLIAALRALPAVERAEKGGAALLARLERLPPGPPG